MSDGTGPRTSGTPAGWFADPLGRYDHRWYNGSAWTADVSVDGERYVDPAPIGSPASPVAAVPPSGAPGPSGPAVSGVPWPHAIATGGPSGWQVTPVAPRPSRTMSVLAFVGGLVAVATGWMPFVFVVGAVAGIAGLVLGIVARRRIAAGRASGSGLATAAVVLAPIGLALCIVGGILTVSVWRELTGFIEAGPNDVEITSCAVDGPGVAVTGTIENLDDESHDYTISLEVYDADELVDRFDTRVDDVAPGEVVEWDDLTLAADDVAEPRCEVFAVNGPFPFGIDPNP